MALQIRGLTCVVGYPLTHTSCSSPWLLSGGSRQYPSRRPSISYQCMNSLIGEAGTTMGGPREPERPCRYTPERAMPSGSVLYSDASYSPNSDQVPEPGRRSPSSQCESRLGRRGEDRPRSHRHRDVLGHTAGRPEVTSSAVPWTRVMQSVRPHGRSARLPFGRFSSMGAEPQNILRKPSLLAIFCGGPCSQSEKWRVSCSSTVLLPKP